MGEPIDALAMEIAQVKNMIAERDRRLSRIEKAVQAIDAADLSRKISQNSEVLVGKDGFDGLKQTVDKLFVVVNGDEAYGSIGLVQQVAEIKKDVAELTRQRNQIKWALFGILSVTTLGNVEGIATLLKSLFP